MEKTTYEQRLEILERSYPVGLLVCNFKSGKIGKVASSPIMQLNLCSILILVDYGDYRLPENTDNIISVDELNSIRGKA